jgi:glycopeptide antibiotics resistance protein
MARRAKRGGRVRPLWVLAVLAATALVLWFTLREDRYVTWQNLTGSNLVPLRHHWAALQCVLDDCAAAEAARTYLLLDVGGNLLLFVPLGLALVGALPLAGGGRRWLAAVAAALVLSAAIEAVQLGMPSRATDVDDVLFNTLGAALGGLAAVVWLRPGRRRRG